MANTLAAVSSVLAVLAGVGECALFGGWAEELLGLRPPGPHHDIDTVHCAADFSAIERLLAVRADILVEVPAKRFAHKRAFLFAGVLCEVLLVQDAGQAPFTLFWGDTRFDWLTPLLDSVPADPAGRPFRVVSRQNLVKYRHERATIRPGRWTEPASRQP